MTQNHVLVKFFSTRDYALNFIRGKFYMNALNFFWNEYPARFPLSSAQADLLEGVVGIKPATWEDSAFNNAVLSDIIFRSIGYRYCNILCFYKLEYQITHKLNRHIVYYPVPNMSDCGNYVVIIKDKAEFQHKIRESFKGTKFKFLCGDVEYRKLQKNGIPINISKSHHLVMKAENPVVISLRDMNITADCFTKYEKYRNQHEWRLAIYRGVKETTPYVHNVGDLTDIVALTTANELIAELDKMFINGELKASPTNYYGNTNRNNMRKLFYKLGDDKCEMLTFLG